MEEALRKPFFIAALVLFGLVVLIELGASIAIKARPPNVDAVVQQQCDNGTLDHDQCSPSERTKLVTSMQSAQSDPANQPRPGFGIRYLALVDAIVLFTLLLMGSSLIVPQSIEGRLQGCATVIFCVLLILLSIVLIFAAIGAVILMVSMLLSVPFGTLAYLIIFGFFDRGGASITLGLVMLLKIAGAVCLVLAQQRILQNFGFLVVVLASLVANVIVAFLQGLVPIFLVSITDAIAAIIVGIIAVILLILLLIGGITSVVKALNPSS